MVGNAGGNSRSALDPVMALMRQKEFDTQTLMIGAEVVNRPDQIDAGVQSRQLAHQSVLRRTNGVKRARGVTIRTFFGYWFEVGGYKQTGDTF